MGLANLSPQTTRGAASERPDPMMHFTCDRCGQEMRPQDARYVAKIEITAAHPPLELAADDLDDEHLDAVAEILQQMGDAAAVPIPPRATLRFDLCPKCREKYLASPLGVVATSAREPTPRPLHFSEN